MSKKVVLSGYYGFDNFGDDAILSVLCEKLKTLNADITVFSANPDKTSFEYKVNSVKNFDILNVLKAIKNTDILISGGGSLLQDATSLKSLIYYSFVIFTALVFKKQVVIFAQGIGPLNRNISKNITVSLLKKAKYVSVRDEKSRDFLKQNGIDSVLVNDPVFSVTIKDVPKNFAVGVQLRDYAGLNDDFLNSLAENVLKYFSDRKIELFVFQKSLDKSVCEKFAGILKSKKSDVDTKIICYKNRQEIFKRIAQLDYMIAMRFHAVIAAVKAGVRTAAVNYDIKVEKLAHEACIPLISTDDKKNDYDAVFENLKSLNPERLSGFSDSKTFDWSGIEALFTE